MSEEWTRATYEGERMVVHELVDLGAQARILRRLPHVNERHMNMTLSVVCFALREKVMAVNVCLTLGKRLTH